jgi:hypothetical protein
VHEHKQASTTYGNEQIKILQLEAMNALEFAANMVIMLGKAGTLWYGFGELGEV